jgi:hypothetical protein
MNHKQRKGLPMRIKYWLLLLIFLLTAVSVAQADVDARVVHTLQLKTAPLDMAVPGNGRYIYVLTSDAQLKIFTEKGKLRDTLKVDPGVDRIKPGPKEDRLFLINSVSNQIQVLFLDFIHEIPVTGSPAKGSADAAVTVTVFTDFQ